MTQGPKVYTGTMAQGGREVESDSWRVAARDHFRAERRRGARLFVVLAGATLGVIFGAGELLELATSGGKLWALGLVVGCFFAVVFAVVRSLLIQAPPPWITKWGDWKALGGAMRRRARRSS